MSDTFLRLQGLTVRYPVAGGLRPRMVQALAPTDLEIARGELLAIVGESGSGKTTLGRAMLRLVPAAAGRIEMDGTDLAALPARDLARLRPRLQMVFQDPYSSLNPRKTVGRALGQVLAHVGVPAAERPGRIAALLERVGLDGGAAVRLPDAFSGGQRQRIAIARALATDPDLIVADEPVSALDVSVQAQVVNLLLDLRADRGLTLVFISHDLGLVSAIASRVCVMYFGHIVEIGSPGQITRAPAHPYTRILHDSVPPPDPATARAVVAAAGAQGAADLPSLMHPPPGCAFAPRCPRASDLCRRAAPVLASTPSGGAVACHHPL